MLRCEKCGLEADRDIIDAWNTSLRGLKQIDVRRLVPRENLSMNLEEKKGDKTLKSTRSTRTDV